MDQSRKAHIISHTHWDREWYLPYEKHHVRLIELMDSLLETMDKDSEYRSFFLDGQTIIIEDYLQVRPEKKEQLEKLITDGRIIIGPWYILQDAYLTSSEANVRNMQIGHQDAERYGTVAKIGYFPDTFGLTGQIPQLMQQSGIDNAFFGRGVKPTGFNNTVSDSGYESSFSELMWEGPDGSKVLGILFANWYSNGNEVPVDEEEAKKFWDRKLADAEKYASTPELLYMNGCDHQPIQIDLPEGIRTAKKLYPDTEFIHSNFDDYLKAVREKLPQDLSSVTGELRSQRTDGWGTLVNTASARVYLKQMNQRGQTLLEKVAEPLASYASLLGKEYPHHLFTYAWKTLMQNHPHDSICGCSVDEVHREMVTRFEKSAHVAENIVDDSIRVIADAVETTGFEQWGSDPLPLVVFNTTGWTRSGTVSIELDAKRLYFREGYSLEETSRRMKEIDLSGRILVNAQGESVPCTVEDLGLQFGYDLPDDRFRQPYMCRRVRLTFEASEIAAMGLTTYAWVKSENKPTPIKSLISQSNVMENELLKVEIEGDGSFTLTDKKNGQVYRDLGVYENTGDIGNEYMYKQPDGETALTTKGQTAQISVLEDSPYRASIEIVHNWSIPAMADGKLDEEQHELVYYPNRKAKRSSEMVPLSIRTVLSLNRCGKGVEIEATMDNQAKDHRVRALFPTDLQAASHNVDSMFEVAKRDNEPAAEWENPSYTAHQQAFVDVTAAAAGLTVANQGLNEYEVLRDGRNTIAVTLLRSVGELGDWGYFPTPEAQCIGVHTVRMEVIPHQGDGIASGAYAEAYQFQIPWTVAQTGVHAGTVASTSVPLGWSHEELAFSSLKVNRKTGDLMLRWFNMAGTDAELKLQSSLPTQGVYKSSILEEEGSVQSLDDKGSCTLPVKPYEIVTLGVKVSAE
ncbi:alpha-mannosidase [Paenibacillus glucanolyticus]|jgi:alpha-mannosidase|uniref:alpha-mannosidase n=1 Tax=Paenibacillus TaxID=44249 RepID=UPI0003E232B3|nr:MULTISPECIES: alpha-mannosidase [Paenibacillus]ANA81735.1 alpha-mannosidase [Paenibacillus glucanolyticus]AVV59533.1 alpha-mannosidase [Paenibacillus glucanolyticus]ETT42177.1 glycoside hydrolase family protein [Paenibacillus sp. FSL R5-808]MPY20568.1 alpha-mannosidase [Paenibacillus glucanolyticus]